MAVLHTGGGNEVTVEVGVYEELSFPEALQEDIGAQKASKTEERYLTVIYVSFGLLCVLQGILNIALRLSDPLSPAGDAFSLVNITEEPNKTAAANSSCFVNWRQLGSSCYFVSSERRDWDRSRLDCQERGADLVIINTREEQEFLHNLTRAAWIGLTDREVEGRWRWVDGTPVIIADGLFFAPGQPDDSAGGEDCGDIRTQGRFRGLNDANCSLYEAWICERQTG